MLEGKKYKAYTSPEDWAQFFTAMGQIAKQISKKSSKLEKESGEYKQKYERAFAEKEEAMAKY